MFSHIFIGARDFERAFAFYTALADVLGIEPRFVDRDRPWAGWQSSPGPRPLLLIGAPHNAEPHAPGNGQMVAFVASSRSRVDEAYRVALASGGVSEGPPGPRPEYHQHYYGAYFRDTEGNKLCVVSHAPAEPEGVQLRRAVPEDALCLSVLATQVFLDTYATEGIRPGIAREALSGYSKEALAAAIADPRARVCVAERARHLVGFAHVTLGTRHDLAPAGQQAELLRLYVQEPFTGKSIGSLLLAEAERLASEGGASVLWLTPWVHNHRALAFYLRRGYQDYGLTHFVFEGESHENRLYARHLRGKTPRC